MTQEPEYLTLLKRRVVHVEKPCGFLFEFSERDEVTYIISSMKGDGNES